MPNPSKIFSFGGGVQSTAALVLAARREIDYRHFVFANTGDDSENPDTLTYFKNFHIPYAAKHGLTLVERRRIIRAGEEKGQERTLYEHLYRDDRTIDIPIRLKLIAKNGKVSSAPGKRNCTKDWKINVIGHYTKEECGATPQDRIVMGLGISTDEIHRMGDSRVDWQINAYPLIYLGLSREDCLRIIALGGLPEPPKSSCWFCPFKRIEDWRYQHEHQPELFEKSVQLERWLNYKRDKIRRDEVFLSGAMVPLDEVFTEGLTEDLDDECSGSCHT